MRKDIVVLFMLLLCVLGLAAGSFASQIYWEDLGRGNLNLKAVLLEPDNPKAIYIGAKNAVLKSEDASSAWRTILSVRGQNKSVNFLTFDPAEKSSIYAATSNGLFSGSDQGKTWRRIFQGKDYLENDCTSVAILPHALYLGTRAGLFVSQDKGRTWSKEREKLGKSEILNIASNLKAPNYIYVASIDGVFRTKDSAASWEKIFLASPTEKTNDTEEEAEDDPQEEWSSDIRYITSDPNQLNYLYLATAKGVYQSRDQGDTWELLSSYGLLSQEVKFILVSWRSDIYAVTKSGIFVYRDSRWEELSLGLAAEEITYLAMDKQDNLYAASREGLFKASLKGFAQNLAENLINLYCQDEPRIKDVQQAAIKYAEVEPEKIKEWRRKAKMKAILPKLTVGLDRSQNSNYEIYTSATTRYVYEGPNDTSGGWDVTLTWELGDLIWNDDQTSIDVRSRLTVQLRDDILDEVNKLYFERLRVKMELDNLSLEERKKRFEKELRLEELVASLDALTGGYFSQNRDRS